MINHTTKEWNVEAIRLLLPHHEAQILKLPLSSMAMEDEIVWLPEKSGNYSTKSGYALAKVNMAGQGAVSFDWRKKHLESKLFP